MPIILNFMFILASRIVHQILHQNCDIEMICSYGQKFIPLNWLLRKLLLRSRTSKYVAEFSRSSSSIASFILSNSQCSLLLLFLAIVRNFIFWPCVVILNFLSLSSEKRKIFFEQDIQYQGVYIYIYIYIYIFFLSWIFSWMFEYLFYCISCVTIVDSYSYSNSNLLLLL